MAGRSAFVPVVVAEHLSWDDVIRVSANAPLLPGVIPEVGLSRFYPDGPATSHVIGYVGPVSEADLATIEDPDPVLQIPRFQIGKTGIEAKLEGDLRGHAGAQKIEVSAAGRVMRELSRVEGTAGNDLYLTLDLGLQSYAMQRWRAQSAAAVIDVTNGDIVALASAPGFDPNSFVFGISSPEWKGLLADDYRPLANKTITGTYPPGSTFKVCMALAALDAGVVSPARDRLLRRRHQARQAPLPLLGPRRPRHVACARLAQSCDCYYYEMGRRLGPDRIAAMAHRLGLGVRPTCRSAVSEGNMPDAAWKKSTARNPGPPATASTTASARASPSPPPAARADDRPRRQRHGGQPRLLRAIDGTPQPGPAPRPLGISAAHLQPSARACTRSPTKAPPSARASSTRK